MRVVGLLAVLAVVVRGAAALPLAVPVSTSYASSDPTATAQWFVDFLDAEIVRQNQSTTIECQDEVDVAWVRLPQSGYEFHFYKQLTKPDGGDLTIEGYVNYADELNGNLSETTPSTYNKYEDFHVGMSVGNLTGVFNKLRAGSVPFFMVGADGGEDAFYDLFVAVPHTGYILEFSSLVCDLPPGWEIQGWDICNLQAMHPELEFHLGTGRPTAESLRSNFGTCTCDGCDDDSVCWRKTTVASVHPEIGSWFTIERLGAQWTRQGHPGVNVQGCALIAWSQFDCGYQLHFVNGKSYPEGDMPLDDFIAYIEDTRDLEGGVYDQWLDNKLTLWVDDLAPFLAEFNNASVPFLLRGWPDDDMTALLVDIPKNGAAIELLSANKPTGVDVPVWDFCAAV